MPLMLPGPVRAWGPWISLSLALACAQWNVPSDTSAADDGRGAVGTGRVPEAVPLRVATYNVGNLFNDRVDAESETLEEVTATLTPGEYRAKLSRVARVIAQLEADIVMLQEVENRNVLEELAATPELGGAYPTRLLVEGNDPRGVDIALLAALPVSRQRTHRNDVFCRRDVATDRWYRFGRDCLEVQLQVGNFELLLLGVHLRSKRDDDPDRRLVEAQHVRFVADVRSAERPGIGVIILGDFNDVPGSRTLLAIEGSPAACACSGPSYASVGRWLPIDQRWTARSPSALGGVALHDDLVVSPALDALLDPASVRVLHDEQLPAEARAASDHAPLAATFWLASR